MLTKNGTDQNLSSPKPPLKPQLMEPVITSQSGFAAKTALAALLLASLLLGSFIYFNRALKPYTAPVPKRLSKQIADDLALLERRGALPKNFETLYQVEISAEGSTFKPWTDEIKLPLKTSNTGTHTLQLFVFFYVDGNKYGANVQYDLLDSKTKNTVWELTRSYELGWIF